jgi:hypothetical protein
MARWSDCYQLREIALRRSELQSSGVYELGFVRRPPGSTQNEFTPFYVGKATVLYNRLSSYVSPRCHNEFVRIQHETGHLLIWYHTFRTLTFAESEARLQNRLGIGRSGYYHWNRRLEFLRRNDELM